MKIKIGIGILIVLVIAVAMILSGGFFENKQVRTTKEESCANSGGVVSKSMCCGSAEDFPNTCLVGACGCAPNYSHEVKTCDCGEGRCFDGTKCTSSGTAGDGTQITKEQAIQIANATEEVQEFLKMYPDANFSVYSLSCNGAILLCHQPLCGNIMNSQSSDYYVIEIRKENLCLGVSVFAVNGSLRSVRLLREDPEYPNHEKSILFEGICKNDDDCVCEKEYYGCINEKLIKSIPGRISPPPSCRNNNDCKCLNNTCTAVKEPEYACPPLKTINCMPIVPQERAWLCSGPYHEWVNKNCDIMFTY